MPKAKRKKRSSRKGKARKGWTLRGFLLLWAFLLLAGVIVFFIFQAHEEKISLKGLKDYFTKKMTLSPKKREISLFFADSQAHYLVKEGRKVYAKGSTTEQARDLIKALISGSKKGMVPTLPPGTSLRGISIDPHGTAHVDFSIELIQGHPGGSSAEIMTIYSVVNSLVLSFPQIQRVKILIQGKERDTLVGHISIKEPLEADLKLVRSSS